MGRAKAAPKKRHLEEEKREQEAIQSLLQADQDDVEQAAADATRAMSQNWPRVPSRDEDNGFILPGWLEGLGRSRTLPETHFRSLQILHNRIKDETTAQKWASWSGAENDPRRRAFGILPGSLGSNPSIRNLLDISSPWSKSTESGNERDRNHQAIVELKDLPQSIADALDFVCSIFRDDIHPSDSRLRKHITCSNLVAAQPNLHCGRELLPAHVDHPNKDGFGVVIVTIGMVGSGKVLLSDNQQQNKALLTVAEGQMYMLSGKLRNACTHGVLAAPNNGHRESLNLRFGLHNLDREGFPPVVRSEEVLQHWEVLVEKETTLVTVSNKKPKHIESDN